MLCILSKKLLLKLVDSVEIALAVQPRHDDDTHMSGCIKADRADGLIWLHITRIGFQDAEAAGNLLQKFFTRLLPGQAALIARSGTGDRLMDRTVLRQIRQANVNERVCVRNDKSGTLNRSKKDRRIDAFTTLSFVALPVIPSLRLLDTGLYDVDESRFIR